MKKVRAFLARAYASARAVWKKEPARVTSTVVAIAIFAAAKGGVVIPQATLVEAVAGILPIIFGGEIIRSKVTPTQ